MTTVVVQRIIKSGFTGFLRNLGLSMTATFIMTITLFIISIIITLYTFTNVALDIAKNQVGGVTAYFNDNIAERDINNIKAEIELMPNVKQVTYISSEEALEKFKEIERLKNRTAVLESLGEFGENEIILPASLTIVAENLDDYTTISQNLGSDRYAQYFKSISDNKKVIDRLNSITKSIQTIGVLVVAIFIVITVVVIFNTIRLAIFNRRDEVEIMRLVGATNSYIRAPFFIESVIYAVLASIVTFGVALLFFTVFAQRIDSFFDIGGLSAGLRGGLLLQIGVLNLLLSIVLGIVSSSIAMRRYLRI
jgi:cell division transport system permease protein